MYKEYIILIFVSVIALGFLPCMERIIFGDSNEFTFKELKKIEKFGTETEVTKRNKSSKSSTSTEQILSIINNNKKQYNDSLNIRIYRELKPRISKFQKVIEGFINISIKDIKSNKQITDRVILGNFFDSDEFSNFKKDLYTKLNSAQMDLLYEPIKVYFGYLNSKFLPEIFKKLLIKKKFKMTKEDNYLIKTIVSDLMKTNMEFKLSEYIFMELLLNNGEQKTFNSDVLKKKLTENPDYLKRKNPLYNIKYFFPLLKVKLLDKMRFETFLFYLTFLYRKFHRQIIMMRKLSLINSDRDLKQTYKTFLVKTATFVSKVNNESLKIFKKHS